MQETKEILANWKRAEDAVEAAEGKMMVALQRLIGKQVYYAIGNMKRPALYLVIDADYHGSRVLLKNLATKKTRWVYPGRLMLTKDGESFSAIYWKGGLRRADEQATKREE